MNYLFILSFLVLLLFLFYFWITFLKKLNPIKINFKEDKGIPQKKYGSILYPIYNKPNKKIIYWFLNNPDQYFHTTTDKSGLAFLQMFNKQQKDFIQYKII